MLARLAGIVALAFVAISALALAQPASSTSPYKVIVHPENPRSAIEREFLADAFLKKATRWDDGELIRPVDLLTDSVVRRKFTSDVLKRSVAAVKTYWQQQIFSGRDIPPPELETDAAVRDFVLKHRGAVGYVSGAADTGQAKVIAVR